MRYRFDAEEIVDGKPLRTALFFTTELNSETLELFQKFATEGIERAKEQASFLKNKAEKRDRCSKPEWIANGLRECVGRPLYVAAYNFLRCPVWILDFLYQRYVLGQLEGKLHLGMFLHKEPFLCKHCEEEHHISRMTTEWTDADAIDKAKKA